MKKFTLKNGVRHSAQGISFVIGALGIACLGMGVAALLGFEWWLVFMSLFFFAIGGCLLRVAYLMIWRYSKQAVKNFAFVVSFFLIPNLVRLFEPEAFSSSENQPFLERLVFGLAGLALAVLFYFALKAFIVKATDLEETPQLEH